MEKYARLPEQAVQEALLGYLIEQGVDIAELRERTTQVQNQYVAYSSRYNVSGNEFNAAVSFGSRAVATSIAGESGGRHGG